MTLEQLLIKLKEDLELDAIPKKNPLGKFVLSFIPTQEISLSETEKGVVMQAGIGEFPPTKQEEFALFAMKGNFLGQGTGRSVLGLDESEKILTLSCVLPYEIDYSHFKASLEEFSNYLGYWQEMLTSFKDNNIE